jgi:hypothetical protein
MAISEKNFDLIAHLQNKESEEQSRKRRVIKLRDGMNSTGGNPINEI